MSPRNLAISMAGIMLVLIASGCVNLGALTGNRPEDTVKTIPEVQSYIDKHPDFDLSVVQRSEGYIRGRISDISKRCGPYFKITDYWEVVIGDPSTRTNITVWLEKDTRQLACLYGEGIGSPPLRIPRPEKTELTIIGFSNLDVDDETTEISDGVLYLTVSNPGPGRITIKRVIAAYLDAEITNTTNTGMLSQGESFTYAFDFDGRLSDKEPFWIDIDVLYDMNDRMLSNQRSKGSIISGLDTSRILQCMDASFEISRYNFFIGTRILSANIRNTGDTDIRIRSYFRQGNNLTEVIEPFILRYGESKAVEYSGLNKMMDSIILVSDTCPGAYDSIDIEDIPGV